MQACNVDFFDLDFNNVYHDIIDCPSIDDDYLSPQKNSIEISYTNTVAANNLIYISGPITYLGIVTGVKYSNYLIEVSFSTIQSLFKQDVLFDTNRQNDGTTLENALKEIIDRYWVNNSDSLQRLPLNVTTSSSTSSWGFNLKSDTADKHHCIIDFYNVLIKKSIIKYGVVITITPDFENRRLDVVIGTIPEIKKIEANLNTVKIDSFTLNSASTQTNKLEIWNTDNYTQSIIYYLHTDHSYNTTDNDRITPVVLAVKSAGSDNDHTFAQNAATQASNTFSGIEWENLIELTVANDDMLVLPGKIKIGQNVEIIRGNTQYTSILTGKNLSNETQLIFGTVRNDLTKILKE